jgi:hypothetical protein
MKAGDLVRFRPAPAWVDELRHGGNVPWLMGLLIEYHKWEKVATVFYDDRLIRVPARDVQKYGRRYLNE